MKLAMDLGRDISPAAYVRHRRPELGSLDAKAALAAAIEAGLALEEGDAIRASRYWRYVLRVAEREGGAARRAGLGSRELVAGVARVRDEIDLILFDGWLPPDLAARAARLTSKMSARYLDRALSSYWRKASSEEKASSNVE